jgi:hypothetical protein
VLLFWQLYNILYYIQCVMHTVGFPFRLFFCVPRNMNQVWVFPKRSGRLGFMRGALVFSLFHISGTRSLMHTLLTPLSLSTPSQSEFGARPGNIMVWWSVAAVLVKTNGFFNLVTSYSCFFVDFFSKFLY